MAFRHSRAEGDPVNNHLETVREEDVHEVFDDDGDVAMDSDQEEEDEEEEEEEEITVKDSSIACMDAHKSSVFCIAQHPLRPSLVATGGSEGDDDDAPGMGYVTDTPSVPGTSAPGSALPASRSADAAAAQASRQALRLLPVCKLDGHTDSITAVTFTQPRGDFLVTGGLDGRLRCWAVQTPPSGPAHFKFVSEAQEVKEINFIVPSPSPTWPNTIALGALDGSVWVYAIETRNGELSLVQSYFAHSSSVTAGTWSPDGNLLATVDEGGSLYVWDVFGAAASKGLARSNGGTSVVALTAADSRFAVEGGLYSVAVDPRGGAVAVGGATGEVKVVLLPRLDTQEGRKGGKGSKGRGGSDGGSGGRGGEGQAGQVIMASLSAQTDSVETLAFAPEPLTLLAAGSVDGSIAIFDTSRQYGLRRHLVDAHDGYAVVKVDWVKGAQWLLTSCGVDGVVRRWDLRSSAGPHHEGDGASSAMTKEWRGYRGEGEGGGVMGFVQTDDGNKVVTAGDDGLVLVFET